VNHFLPLIVRPLGLGIPKWQQQQRLNNEGSVEEGLTHWLLYCFAGETRHMKGRYKAERHLVPHIMRLTRPLGRRNHLRRIEGGSQRVQLGITLRNFC
jgi:hypothetical protein